MRTPAKRTRAERSAASLVDEILRRYGVAGEVREHRLVTGWAEIVGERVLARAFPDGLEDGVLYVRVSNSAWLHELSFLKDAIVTRANAMCGARIVKEVKLHLGSRRNANANADDRNDVVAALARRMRPRKQAATPRPQPSPAALRAIDDETAKISDPELRDTIRDLRRRLGL
jgi:hypothetical protein